MQRTILLITLLACTILSTQAGTVSSPYSVESIENSLEQKVAELSHPVKIETIVSSEADEDAAIADTTPFALSELEATVDASIEDQKEVELNALEVAGHGNGGGFGGGYDGYAGGHNGGAAGHSYHGPSYHGNARFSGAASSLTKSNARCTMCQFIIQRLHADLTVAAPGVYLQSAAAAAAGAAKDGKEGEKKEEGGEEKKEGGEEKKEEAGGKGEEAASLMEVGSFRFQNRNRHNFFNHGETPRRFRGSDMLEARPARVRYQNLNTPSPDPSREMARAAYQQLYQQVYQSFEQLCTRRMPFAYLPYCKAMLKSYRYIAQGIHYGDRPEQICMNGNFCDGWSYIRLTPHSKYVRAAGDA